MSDNAITLRERRKALSRKRQALMALAPEKAMDAILVADHPTALVHSFPEPDLHLLIRDIGPGDALSLIALASDRQREYILDMEIWDRDRIDLPSAGQWLDLFHRADPARLAGWLMGPQTAFTEYYLFKNIRVVVREHDQDPSDFGDDFFTVDNTFYVKTLDRPGEDADTAERRKTMLERLLRQMADNDHDRYLRLLLEAAAVIPAEHEEAAYRLRNVRLAEQGFVPFEEAVGIYQPLNRRQFDHRGKRVKRPEPAPADVLPVPLYPVRIIGPASLFAAALNRVQSAQRLDQIQMEFATLCNTLAVADRKKIDSRDALSVVVDKACGYLSMGIESVVGDDRDTGCLHSARLLQRHTVADIFRLGYGLAVDIKHRAEKWHAASWFRQARLPLTFWGESWVGVLGGILLKHPLYFDNYESGVLYREFTCIREIESTASVLSDIMAFDGLLGAMNVPVCGIRRRSPLNYKNVVLTLWCRHCLNLDDALEPLPHSAFRTFFADLWETAAEPKPIRPSRKTDFLHWLAARSGMAAGKLSDRLAPVLEALFSEIEAEYQQVAPKDLDPRYVDLFIIEE